MQRQIRMCATANHEARNYRDVAEQMHDVHFGRFVPPLPDMEEHSDEAVLEIEHGAVGN